MLEEIQTAIRLGDVRSDREGGLVQESGFGGVGELDAVQLDTNISGRLENVHPLCTVSDVCPILQG